MDFFKLYCHPLDADTSAQPIECKEVSIQASPEVLREVAQFLIHSANAIEERPTVEFLHFHLSDIWKSKYGKFPDLIAISPPLKKSAGK